MIITTYNLVGNNEDLIEVIQDKEDIWFNAYIYGSNKPHRFEDIQDALDFLDADSLNDPICYKESV